MTYISHLKLKKLLKDSLRVYSIVISSSLFRFIGGFIRSLTFGSCGISQDAYKLTQTSTVIKIIINYKKRRHASFFSKDAYYLLSHELAQISLIIKKNL